MSKLTSKEVDKQTAILQEQTMWHVVQKDTSHTTYMIVGFIVLAWCLVTA
jgi:hypothetical protein